ncbi:peptide chain release factor N(5)-glutamine methyltransferase [Edaphobacillus lindanitolerans]|uniref:Release factor glutamine methyltransferase n=1 Tax=Edaphobacillus lindanitolerans TaxID=550447 RepID=A0A1U7PK10_9BACI|nr:peptide chain release factor N(5)-glutamine methyltransferase [Edaphobacillus lindanitolerans]SIT69663.1 release factor glutamine methyltransferase [Edaphobacillus lindanitolerans]
MQRNDTIASVLAEGKRRLQEAGREEFAAELLMQHVLGTNRTGLLIKLPEKLEDAQRREFSKGIQSMESGIPLQYVTGREAFYGRPFRVTPDVLIPRPETEELVDRALARAARIWPAVDRPLHTADIGTGSGAIAVSFKLERPSANVTATDISPAALRVAAENARLLGAEVSFLEGDMAAPLEGREWDIVLSNPPYIAPDEAKGMSDSVTGHEPHAALFAEQGGLAHYRTLARTLPGLMRRPGLIGLEIGHLQGPAVSGLFAEAFPDGSVEVVQDINGKDRIVFCELSK